MQRQLQCWLVLCCAFLWCSAAAHADLLDRLNNLRRADCEPSRPPPALRRSSGLDEVAMEWAKGSRLAEAVAHTHYQGVKFSSMTVQGGSQDAQVVAALRSNYCRILTDPRFSEVGLFRRNDGVWIVVAAPLILPSADDASRIRLRILQLVNQARSEARMCGEAKFEPAAPLRDSTTLSRAALEHAQDMAQHQFFQHLGSDGSDPGARATRARYLWSRVAENIAAGVMSPEEVVAGWLASPGHCANIMQPLVTEMGSGYATTSDGKFGIYWAQVFARPK
jgi:uncharacterized protein YkwD